MISKVMEYITKYEIIKPNDRVIAGVSGGADSVCLFLVLNELRENLNFEFEVIHVEHGIRGESSVNDAAFTSNLCAAYGIPCHVINVDVPALAEAKGLGLEEAARLLRYKAFADRARITGAKVALAHHLEDNAETVIFQMVRGSGLHGMTGMEPKRTSEDKITYIRPLLGVSRREIEAFLAKRRQSYCTDDTNFDIQYDRNRIRHNIIPELEHINDRALLHINQTAQKLSVIDDYINLQVKHAIDEVLSIDSGKYYIDAKKLDLLHPAIKSECVLEILGIAAGRKKDIGAVHVNQVMELLHMQSGKKIMLPYSLEAQREYNQIVVYSGMLEECEGQIYKVSPGQLLNCVDSGMELEVELEKSGEKLVFRAFDFDGDFDKIPQKPYTKWVDYDKIKDGFCIRKRQNGDFFINDSKGHRKKLKEFFTDAKIPLSERENIWLLAAGQEVIIVAGHRISEAFKVNANTHKVLEVIYIGRK